jgi:hypothetical protein
MKRCLPWFLVMSIFLLSSCTTTYPRPAPRSLYDINSSATPDDQIFIAVSPDGTKHILRAECPAGANPSCKLTYESTRIGEIGVLWYFTPAGGYTFRNPDVTVTDSNVAYLIWQNCPAGASDGRSCATWYTRSDDMQAHVLDLGTHSLSAPILASRGETVYAVHEVTNNYANGSALRFCRISDPSYTCRWVSGHPTLDDGVRRTNAAAAVSAAGTLHVAWLEGAGPSKTGYYNDNAGAPDSDMAHLMTMGSGPFFPPAMAIQPNDAHLYISLAANESTSDWMRLFYCAPYDCQHAGGVKTIELPVSRQWYLLDAPSLTASDDWAFFGFAAVTSDHPTQSDIYLGTCSPTSSSCGVNRPYPTVLEDYSHDCDPVVALVDGWMAVGWHVCGFTPMSDDVSFYDTINGGRIIHATDWQGRGGLAMAANGEYVAGIWNEIQSDGRLATWLAFNAHMTYLPVVRK